MSIPMLLSAYPELRLDIQFLLNLQNAEMKSSDHDLIFRCRLLLDQHGPDFLNQQADAIMESTDGKCDLSYLIKIYEEGVAEKCDESRRSCPCKHGSRQRLDALIDLSKRLLRAIIDSVEEDIKHAAEIIEMPWE